MATSKFDIEAARKLAVETVGTYQGRQQSRAELKLGNYVIQAIGVCEELARIGGDLGDRLARYECPAHGLGFITRGCPVCEKLLAESVEKIPGGLSTLEQGLAALSHIDSLRGQVDKHTPAGRALSRALDATSEAVEELQRYIRNIEAQG